MEGMYSNEIMGEDGRATEKRIQNGQNVGGRRGDGGVLGALLFSLGSRPRGEGLVREI